MNDNINNTVEPLNKGHLVPFGGCPLLGGFSEKVE